MELTKQQKKQVRILLDLDLQRMYERAIKGTFKICEEFDKNPDNPHDCAFRANARFHLVEDLPHQRGNKFNGLNYMHVEQNMIFQICFKNSIEQGIIQAMVTAQLQKMSL